MYLHPSPSTSNGAVPKATRTSLLSPLNISASHSHSRTTFPLDSILGSSRVSSASSSLSVWLCLSVRPPPRSRSLCVCACASVASACCRINTTAPLRSNQSLTTGSRCCTTPFSRTSPDQISFALRMGIGFQQAIHPPSALTVNAPYFASTYRRCSRGLDSVDQSYTFRVCQTSLPAGASRVGLTARRVQASRSPS